MSTTRIAGLITDTTVPVSPAPRDPSDAETWAVALLDRAGQRLALLHTVLVEHLGSDAGEIPAHARKRLAAEALHLDGVLRQIDALVQEARPNRQAPSARIPRRAVRRRRPSPA
ncbi:MAG: hypothetical protein R3F39_12305 [Myxococcota bacterium]